MRLKGNKYESHKTSMWQLMATHKVKIVYSNVRICIMTNNQDATGTDDKA